MAAARRRRWGGGIGRSLSGLKSQAEGYLESPQRTRELLDAAGEKLGQKAGSKGVLGGVWAYLTALLRLVRAYARRDYRDVAWSSIVLSVAAIIYFVNPIDIVPDALVALGFVDDAAVVAFVARRVKRDLDKFMAWEELQGRRSM